MSDACVERDGTVVKVKGGKAFVEIEKTAECGGCKACMLAGSKKSVVLPTKCAEGAKVGQTVRVLLPPPRPVAAMLLLFALPLFTLLAGVTAGYLVTESEPMLALAAAVGLLAGLAVVLVLDRAYLSKKYTAKIIKIQGDNAI